MSEEQEKTQEAGTGREKGAKRILGGLFSVFGILLALPGLLDVRMVGLFAAVGGLLGVVGAFMGARRLGMAAIVVSGVVLLVGLAMIFGLLPTIHS